MIEALEAFWRVSFDPIIVETDYSIHSCNQCTLEFADPLLEGSEVFYDALVRQPGYYSSFRPEYKVVAELICEEKNESPKILDIGCGTGDFLSLLKTQPGAKFVGIDTTETSIRKCREKNIEAYCTRVEDFKVSSFDFIVSFHCLEHTRDPLSFIFSALHLLKDKGKLYIATPYSPLMEELYWFHPLNNPPHHLLRFNKKSYEQLAKETQTQVKLVNFLRPSLATAIRSAFSFAKYGKNMPGSKASMAMKMAQSPLLSAKVILHLTKRERIDGDLAGNDIIAIFEKR